MQGRYGDVFGQLHVCCLEVGVLYVEDKLVKL